MRLRLFVAAMLLCALSIQCSDNPGAGTDCALGSDCAKILRCENDICVPADGFVNPGGDSALPEDTESDVDNEDTKEDSTNEDTISDISEEDVASDVATDTAINDSTEDIENKCGNGFVDEGEDCDDGNDNEEDMCHSDCTFTCGDGQLQPMEECDTAIADGEEGACPSSCESSEDCSVASVQGNECAQICVVAPLAECIDGDSCCGFGCNNLEDPECPAVCGNGFVESGETCDPTGTCPTSCNDDNSCTADVLSGELTNCNAVCTFSAIADCANGDGCCPAGCTSASDNDCSASCGNGFVDPGESCDPPESCPESCDDSNACTADTLTGSKANCNVQCSNVAILEPLNGDKCCPAGGNAINDSDCDPLCDNAVLESGESCDPPESCPTLSSCNDSDNCTTDSLTGDAQQCSAACVNEPITAPTDSDSCCPDGANANNDNDCKAQCNNSVLESGESCDPPGTCPSEADCNDNNSCTADSLSGSAANCNAVCVNTPITLAANNDGCCPEGANANNDNDCSTSCGNSSVEAGESCDPPDSCPDAADCNDANSCTADSLTGSAATCNAVCVNTAITLPTNGDGCCPNGANANNDNDCNAQCGNSAIEADETCDPPGTCPTKVDCNDNNSCTTDSITGSAAACNAVCVNLAITLPNNDDGCCPAGANANNDNDCSAQCGNSNVEAGETCDPPGSCPAVGDCNDNNSCTTDTLSGSAAACTAVCVNSAIVKCGSADGCCPADCNNNNDKDCSANCGNSTIESGETCDPPSSCPSATACNDNQSCTADSLSGSAANCNALCVNTPITQANNGDGCCPAGANANNDNDCQSTCNNGVVEAGETCDPPNSCPNLASCNDSDSCTGDSVAGSAAKCTAACVNTPITQPANSDGCCPAGATANNDNDCNAQCNNGVVEAGETCDPPASCPSASSCNDNNSCTTDSLTGTASNCTAACVNNPISLPANSDGCCPAGANANNDNDCQSTCNNGVVEAGETCDPQASCPNLATCNDGVACTADSLSGSATNCTASCVNSPINQPANNDGCCPAGATANNDNDCNAQCGNGSVEAGETCDPPGTCPSASSCNDNNSCTADSLTGSASNCTAACINNPISLPANNDGCCPAAANANNDNDCQSTCNNSVVEPGETCDPPGSCPSEADCADANACTTDSLTGSADNCTAQCTNVPITNCISGDGCCPDSCNSGNDSDCGGAIDPNSTVTTTSSCLTRTTNAQAAVVVTLVDTNGNGVTGAAVTMTSSTGSLSAVQSNGNTYWAVLAAPSSGVSTQLSVTADGINLNTQPTINFVAPFTSLVGGMGGCPADGNARIRVVTPAGAPIQNALVMLGNSAAPASLQSTFNIAADSDNTGTTGAGGYVEFHDFGTLLDGGITVTAVIAGRRYMTFVDGNASDFIVPLASINPVGQKGVFTGDITGFNAPSNNPIELGVQFPEIDLEDFVGFSLDALLSDNECYAAGGFAGNSNIPANIYIPKQCAASVFFCVQTLPEHPYKTAPIPYGPERLLALSGAAPLDALTSGDIGGAVSQITFTKIGMAAVNVSSAGPTTQDINVSSNLIADVSCTLNNAPPSSDVFCLTAGDWDSNAKGITPGAGSLYLSGFKSVDTAATALPTTLTNITRVPKNSAPWAGTDSVSAAAALYLEETKAGVDPGVINGVTIVAQRTNVGTSLNFDTFIPIRTHARTGRNYALSPLPGAKHPAAHTIRTTVNRKVTTIYNGCAAGDSEHVDRQTLWTIYMRGSSNGFVLPTPPASWPGGALGGDIQGLVDVNATPQSDILEWKSMTVHEGLNTGYNFDQMKISSFRESSTHVSSNTVAY